MKSIINSLKFKISLQRHYDKAMITDIEKIILVTERKLLISN